MSTIQNSFVIIMGNSFSIKDTLKRYGFKFEGTYKVWYKVASKEAYKTWAKEITDEAIGVAYVENLNQIPFVLDAHKEAQAEKKLTTEPKSIDHTMTGAVVEMSKWYAQMFKQNNNANIAFRNLKILNVYVETQKAYLVDAEFFGGVACTCGVCGRSLENAISIATGIGPICAEKIGMPRISSVEEAQIVVDEMHKMSKMAGVFKQVWIPKSQIKNATLVEKNEKEVV